MAHAVDDADDRAHLRPDADALPERRVAVLAGVGIVAGAGIALALGSTIGSLLFGVQPDDPATFGVAAGTLALTAMVAAVAPMRAAVRVDPAVTLKADL